MYPHLGLGIDVDHPVQTPGQVTSSAAGSHAEYLDTRLLDGWREREQNETDLFLRETPELFGNVAASFDRCVAY